MNICNLKTCNKSIEERYRYCNECAELIIDELVTLNRLDEIKTNKNIKL